MEQDKHQQIKNAQLSDKTTKPIKYQGKVSVELRDRTKKLISKKNYSNHGCANLFYFLCNCLGQTYNSKKSPQRIVLFGLDNTNFTPDQLFWKTNSVETRITTENNIPALSIKGTRDEGQTYETVHLPILSAPLTLAGSPEVKITYASGISESDSATITYSFDIPGTLITQEPIYIIGLYDGTTVSSQNITANNILAYYCFAATDSNVNAETEQEGWEPLTMTEGIQDLTIHINWQLSLSN